MLWAPMMVVCAECVLGERKIVTKTDFSVVLSGSIRTMVYNHAKFHVCTSKFHISA